MKSMYLFKVCRIIAIGGSAFGRTGGDTSEMTMVADPVTAILEEMATLREQVAIMRETLQGGYRVSFPDLATDIEAIADEIKQIKQDRTNTGGGHKQKSASESKAIQMLKTLKERKEFKCWHGKFMNAITQLYPKARNLMKLMKRNLDERRREVKQEDWEEAADVDGQEEQSWKEEELIKFNDDLYYILIEKTEEEAAQKIHEGGDEGDGFGAYKRLYLWFAGVSGQALNERARIALQPTAPKKSEEVADALGRWLEQLKYLRNHGKDYNMTIPFRTSALRTLMSNFKDQFEAMYNPVRK